MEQFKLLSGLEGEKFTLSETLTFSTLTYLDLHIWDVKHLPVFWVQLLTHKILPPYLLPTIGNLSWRCAEHPWCQAMVEGTRVECIIGATRIRDFSTATEVGKTVDLLMFGSFT